MNSVYRWRDAPAAEFAVIGDPVAHSLSPKMHSAAYLAVNLPYRYCAIHVSSGEVGQALDHLDALGYRGVNVTVPHKEEVLAWAEDVEPLARQLRAANTLRLTDRACINTDLPGFLDTLAEFRPVTRTALLLGAGGSARAVAFALVREGYDLYLHNRTFDKAAELASEIGLPVDRVRAEADPTGAALVVNTTSAHLSKEELPILWDHSEPGALAYDLMYADEPTPFLQRATAHGLLTVDGRRMLVAQGARSFEWWLGIEAPREAMLDAIG